MESTGKDDQQYQVSAQLHLLDTSLNNVADVFGKLEGRLEGVLMPNEPQAENAVDDRPVLCDIAHSIRANMDRADRIHDCINSVLSRLEV